jgi:hypothetical protein
MPRRCYPSASGNSLAARLGPYMLERRNLFRLTDVREKIERWRHHYNWERLHSALGDRATRSAPTTGSNRAQARRVRLGRKGQRRPALRTAAMPRIQTFTAFRTLGCEGRAGKAAHGEHETGSGKQRLARDCQLSMSNAIKRRKYRHQPTTPGRKLYGWSVYFRGAGHQAEILTAGRHTFAGGSPAADTKLRMGYQRGKVSGQGLWCVHGARIKIQNGNPS